MDDVKDINSCILDCPDTIELRTKALLIIPCNVRKPGGVIEDPVIASLSYVKSLAVPGVYQPVNVVAQLLANLFRKSVVATQVASLQITSDYLEVTSFGCNNYVCAGIVLGPLQGSTCGNEICVIHSPRRTSPIIQICPIYCPCAKTAYAGA